MSALTESPIVIRELRDQVLRLPAWGRFNGAELVYALVTLPNGKARRWTREANESAEIFADGIVRDIVESVRGTARGARVVVG